MPGRFISLFYQAHSLDSTQIGILLALVSFISLPATPFLCNLADRSISRERILVLTHLAAASFFLLQIITVPSLGIISVSARFPLLIVAILFYGFFSAPGYPLVSAISISRLRRMYGDDGHVRFGQVRLWGAVSWAIVAILQGALWDYTQFGVFIPYVGFSVLSLVFVVQVLKFEAVNKSLLSEQQHDSDSEIDSEQNEQAEQSEQNQTDSILSMFNFIVCNGGMRTILFFNLIFWLAVGMSLVENFVFLFFYNDLHASNLLCGLTVLITVIFEVPMFARAPSLLTSLGSAHLAIIGSMAYVVRALGYSIAPNAWFVLLVEPLHGVTYATVHTASVAFVAERTPSHMEATGQSVLEVILCIGTTLGTIVGGYVMHYMGSKFMYRMSAFMVLGATVAFAVVQHLSRGEQTILRDKQVVDENNRENSEEQVAFNTSDEHLPKSGTVTIPGTV